MSAERAAISAGRRSDTGPTVRTASQAGHGTLGSPAQTTYSLDQRCPAPDPRLPCSRPPSALFLLPRLGPTPASPASDGSGGGGPVCALCRPPAGDPLRYRPAGRLARWTGAGPLRRIHEQKNPKSFGQINSIHVINGNFDSCNSCKRLGTSRLHDLHESKFPFITRIEFISTKFSIFSAHVSEVSRTAVGARHSAMAGDCISSTAANTANDIIRLFTMQANGGGPGLGLCGCINSLCRSDRLSVVPIIDECWAAVGRFISGGRGAGRRRSQEIRLRCSSDTHHMRGP